MAIKRSSKVTTSFSASSMTDLVFLLLVFFVLATTLINPNNAVKLTLPSSLSQEGDPSVVSISITGTQNNYRYVFNGGEEYQTVEALAGMLNAYYTEKMGQSGKTLNISVHCDRERVTVQGLVNVIDMINEQNVEVNGNPKYKMVLATKDKK
ncbi:MAG: biopolymer transporter ExbD [Alistipes sp.]|nr:biopolymer transporter ExbD [Alistipes sp.]